MLRWLLHVLLSFFSNKGTFPTVQIFAEERHVKKINSYCNSHFKSNFIEKFHPKRLKGNDKQDKTVSFANSCTAVGGNISMLVSKENINI